MGVQPVRGASGATVDGDVRFWSSCTNNAKQLALGIHSHCDAKGMLPKGGTKHISANGAWSFIVIGKALNPANDAIMPGTWVADYTIANIDIAVETQPAAPR